MIRQLSAAGLTIPFLERLRRDLPFDQQLRELTPLRLALERHERCFLSPALEELDRALVSLGGGTARECPEITSPAGFRILLPRIEPILARRELADHDPALSTSLTHRQIERASRLTGGDTGEHREEQNNTAFHRDLDPERKVGQATLLRRPLEQPAVDRLSKDVSLHLSLIHI